jgi:hypothetical protein
MPAAGFALAFVAIVVAAIACTLALVLMRQNATTTEELREHRRAHRDAYGYPDPRLDRRQRNLPPPTATGERRGQRPITPPVDAHMPPREPVEQQPATAEHAPPTAAITAQRPAPGPHS